MGHNYTTDQTGGGTPRCRPNVFLGFGCGLEFYSRCTRKVLTQKVRRAGLQSLAILHHGFNGQRINRTGKSFRLRFATAHNRHRQIILGKLCINIEHHLGSLLGFLGSLMGRMALLPQKFTGPQKEPGSHFPSHDIGPLIN